jgi:hypothetical protein
MNNETKLIFALMQIDNINNLIKENEYEQFMVLHLTALKVEMQRQLSNLSNPACASSRAVH